MSKPMPNAPALAQPDRGYPPARWFAAVRSRCGVLLALALLVGGGGVGYWAGWHGRPTGPDLPRIDLTDTDPEVAAALDRGAAAVRAAPGSAAAWGELALLLHAHTYHPEAAACYAAATALDPANPVWPYLRGTILQAQHEPQAALDCFAHSALRSPPNSLPRLRRAELLAELGRLDEAAAEFQTVLAASADDARAHLGLAQVAAARPDARAALVHLGAAADNPYVRKRAAGLALALHERLGERTPAEAVRRRLTQLPDDEAWPDPALDAMLRRTVGLRGRLLQARRRDEHGRHAEGLALLQETVARYPSADAAWLALGRAHRRTLDLGAAERAFQRSVELAPERPECWLALGATRQAQGHAAAALDAFRRAVLLRPTDAAAQLTLGVCCQEQGDRAAAAAAFRQALRYRPELDEARRRLHQVESGP